MEDQESLVTRFVDVLNSEGGYPEYDVMTEDFDKCLGTQRVNPRNRSKTLNSSMDLWWFKLGILKRGYLRELNSYGYKYRIRLY